MSEILEMIEYRRKMLEDMRDAMIKDHGELYYIGLLNAYTDVIAYIIEQQRIHQEETQELLEIITQEAKQENVCVLSLEGLMRMPLKDFVKQPAVGILYDLNRLPEVVVTMMKTTEGIKWINDYAVALTIQELKSQLDDLEQENVVLKTELKDARYSLECISNVRYI